MSTMLPIRIAVEAVIQRGSELLLVKRADNCRVAPSVWNVPAGKVKYKVAPFTETPSEAVKRECKEETGMNVSIIKELAVRIFEMRVGDGSAYRVMHTFLVEPEDFSAEVELNDEHSAFEWVSIKEGWKDPKYESLSDALKIIFEENFR